MPLSVDDLFTPAPSGVGDDQPSSSLLQQLLDVVGAVATTPPPGSWLAQMIANAGVLGLATTSWFPGSWLRTILALVAKSVAGTDRVVSTIAKGGFLDSAAEVTPDPSLPPYTQGTPFPGGWLDLLASSLFDEPRDPATYASGSLTVTCDSTTPTITYQPGQYHAAAGSKTYKNRNVLSLAPSTTLTDQIFDADVAGSASSAAPGTIITPVTSVLGVTITNPAAFIGNDAESNAHLVAKCRLKFQSLSPNGPKGAYEYFALKASDLVPLVTPITRVLVQADPATGTVDVYVANGAGPVPGVIGLHVTAVTNSTPIKITTFEAHGFSTGDYVVVSGTVGAEQATGLWKIHVIDANNFTIDGSTGLTPPALFTVGTVEGEDLGLVDYVIQGNVVPDAVTAIVQSATSFPCVVAVSVWVASSYATTIGAAVTTAIANYFANLPIGGLTDPSGAYTNAIPRDAIIAAAIGAGPIQQATVTVNGGTPDYVAVPPLSVATLTSISVTVHAI